MLGVMTTPTYALRLICDEELGTAVRRGVRRRQATDVSRSLCFEEFFPTPPASRTSYQIYNDCSAVLAYVHHHDVRLLFWFLDCSIGLHNTVVHRWIEWTSVLSTINFSRFRLFFSPGDGDRNSSGMWVHTYHTAPCKVVGLFSGRSRFNPRPVDVD
jgi:hypothetical protein